MHALMTLVKTEDPVLSFRVQITAQFVFAPLDGLVQIASSTNQTHARPNLARMGAAAPSIHKELPCVFALKDFQVRTVPSRQSTRVTQVRVSTAAHAQ